MARMTFFQSNIVCKKWVFSLFSFTNGILRAFSSFSSCQSLLSPLIPKIISLSLTLTSHSPVTSSWSPLLPRPIILSLSSRCSGCRGGGATVAGASPAAAVVPSASWDCHPSDGPWRQRGLPGGHRPLQWQQQEGCGHGEHDVTIHNKILQRRCHMKILHLQKLDFWGI